MRRIQKPTRKQTNTNLNQGKQMLTNKELGELIANLQSLGINLPEGLEPEVCGIAILRFCLAKALRKHQLLTINKEKT